MRRDKLHPSQIPDDAIIASKIADNAVTNAKLADDAVNTAEITNDAVTYAKLQNISAASRVLGRGSAAGAGNAEELTPTGNLAVSGTNITVTDPPTFAGETLSNDLVFSADKLIRRNTSDASDNGSIEINGGGATGQTRGGMLRVYGNEAASVPGWVRASIGNVASSSFVVERADGNEVVNISGADGVTALRFAATQVASANANTLDDYEEGTWTPAFKGSTSNSGQVYSEQSGHYVKCGKICTVTCAMVLSTEGSFAGTLQIITLPFTAASVCSAACMWIDMAVSLIGFYVETSASSATLECRAPTAAATTGRPATDAATTLGATSGVYFTLTYKTTD